MVDSQKTNEEHTSMEEILRHTLVLVERGHSDGFIEKSLVEKGFDEVTATAFLQKVKKARKSQKYQESNEPEGSPSYIGMIWGALWAIGGIVVTVASEGFVIAYGAIIYGVVTFFRGLANS